MRCSACGATNPEEARFCGACGVELAPLQGCPRCSAPARPEQRFCNACGASLAAPASEADPARKLVTIVFGDLVGSTALQERLDAESTRRFMDRYYAAMRSAVEAERGSVTQFLGDGVKAVFGAPRVAEDDALRAVRAAVGMQRAFHELAAEVRGALGEVGLRVAVNTGEVVASDETEIIGDPVNVAAHLQQEARNGDVLIGEATRRLVGELVTLERFGTFQLKGRAEPVSAYRVTSLERPAGAPATPFVGREDELRRLLAVHADTVEARHGRLAVVLGSPGLGKSRLVAEVVRRVEGAASVLLVRCDEAGGASFAPLAAALRTTLGIGDAVGGQALRSAIDAVVGGDEGERGRIAGGIAALLAGSPAPPEETFFVVRRFLAALATAGPVVLAIDDLQWAEPLLLDLVEHLVHWTTDAPLLVLAAARPELREARSSLATRGDLVAEVVTLSGLDAAEATRLAASVIGADALPAAVAGRVLSASEGNPLFVGELVRMLVQDGALVRDGGRWTAGSEPAALEMPPTIQALLGSRIERLRPEERVVLERAAVVGPVFSRAAVQELLPHEGADLDRHLEALRRSELVEPDTGWFLGEPALRFHHVLIRDAAYRRVLKEKRAELHERFADWVAARIGETSGHDEALGWHLEQAHQHLRELGPLDAHGRALGERAARTLGAAGRRALAQDDVSLAAGLLGRALERIDADDPARADLALDWCEALLAAGEVAAAGPAIDELGRFRDASPRLRAWHTCFAGERAALTDPQALHATVEAVAGAAEELASAGDSAGEAKAHFVHAMALAGLGQIGACEATLDRALAAARRGGDRRRANAVLAGAPQAALWGPSPVTRASGRCLDVVRVLRITQSAPAVEAVALRCQGVLEALRGRSEAARRMIDTSRRMAEELGITQRLLEAEVFAGQVELIEGDAVAAEERLRPAYAGLREQGLGTEAARAAALLGRALLAQDRPAEAEAMSHESEALAGDDLKAAIAWRGVRAEALARRGEPAAAVELARSAVDLAAATDALLDHADARLALAAALRAASRSGEAAAEEARAIELWEAKGATLLAERARREAPRAGPATFAPPERRTPARRVSANAASENLERLAAAFAARDPDAIEGLLAEGSECLHHPTGASYDRQGLLTTFQSLSRVQGPEFRQELLATLGDSLALCRMWLSAAGFAGRSLDVGAYEREELCLVDVDADEQQKRVEFFAADKLNQAVVRLYERYAELLPDGAARARGMATVRSVSAFTEERRDGAPGVFAPDVEAIDHRTVGFGCVRGADVLMDAIRTLFELGTDHTWRLDDVLGLQSDAILLRRTHTGRDHAGGRFERHVCTLCLFGPDGLVGRWEQFDADQDTEALARFDELLAPPARSRPAARRVRPNAATVDSARLDAAIAARDLDRVERLVADQLEVVHHPTGGVWDRNGMRAVLGIHFQAREISFTHEPIATLGESLALFHASWAQTEIAGEGFLPFGAVESDEFMLTEVDEDGRRRRVDWYADDHLGDAVARLYQRYAELLPEGPARARAEATARSVAMLLGPPERWPLAPDVEATDHSSVGFGLLRGADAVVNSIRALRQPSDEFDNRMDDVLDLRPDALLVRWTTSGTIRDSGGPYERPLCLLWVFGPDGLVTRWEQFDAEQAAEALARFDELTTGVKEPRFANSATRSLDRFLAALEAHDWERIAAGAAPDCRQVDRRAFMRLELDRDQHLEWLRTGFERPSSVSLDVIATRGDRLALCRVLTLEQDELVGPSENESLAIWEVNDHGERLAVVFFDHDDLDAAHAELDARYAAGEGGAYSLTAAGMGGFVRAIASRDWEALSELLSPELVVDDHGPLGWETLHGPARYVESLQSLVDLAPDVRLRGDHMSFSDRAALRVDTWVGTRDGGDFEAPRAVVFGFDERGLIRSVDLYKPEQLDEARARFAAIGARVEALPADPLGALARPNAASAAMHRLQAAFDARDWADLRAAYRPNARIEDRRRGVRTSQDVGGLVADAQELARSGAHYRRQLVASAGERVALERFLWYGDVPVGGGPFEVEFLGLVEVDGNGQIIAAIRFDPDDRRVAIREAWGLWVARDPVAAAVLGPILELGEAWNDHDLARVRAVLADDLVYHDRRLAGVGPIEGVDALLDALAVTWELSPDIRIEPSFVLACERHGVVGSSRRVGTFPEGGPFEIYAMHVTTIARGRVTRVELFELEAADAALARLEELRPDPLRIPPNAATRASDHYERCMAAGDWDALRALYAPTMLFDDRRRLIRTTGDREMFLANCRLIARAGTRLSRTLVATVGDRLSLERFLWKGAHHGGTFETEVLNLCEVDSEGRCVAAITFDPDDRAAAFLEAQARFAAGEAAEVGGQAPLLAFASACDRIDWEAMRGCLADDFALRDHRSLGLGALDRDGYLESLRAVFDLAAGWAAETVRTLAWNRHGRVDLDRRYGTLRDGGPFENFFVTVALTDGDRVQGYELFDLPDADRALERFEELCADRASRAPGGSEG